MLIKSVFLIFALLSPQIAFADNLRTPHAMSDRSIIFLKDKSGNFYEVSETTHMKNGIAEHYYSLRNTQESQLHNLAGGVSDGVSGRCDRAKELKLKTSTTNLALEVKDINQDRFLDLLVFYKELDCDTGKETTYQKIFYATELGFKENIQ